MNREFAYVFQDFLFPISAKIIIEILREIALNLQIALVNTAFLTVLSSSP